MRILCVTPEYPPNYGGGIITFYKNLLSHFILAGYKVDVIVGSAVTSNLSSYEDGGIKVSFLDQRLVDSYVYKFERYKVMPELQRHLAAAWAIWEQAKCGHEYDLVEVTDWGMLFVPWIVSANSPPTVVQLHASIGQIDFYDPQIDTLLQGNLVRLLESSLLSVADDLHTYSISNSVTWETLTNRKVKYIPPALTNNSTCVSTSRLDNGLVVGRIQYWKGVTVLCEALRLLEDKAPNIDWIGRDTVYQEATGSMSAYLMQEYGDVWQKNINPIGTFTPEETLQRQAMAKFIVVPSIWDVFNFAGAEGMAQGKVVLCSQGAGVSDLIVNEVNGLLFKENDPKSLANCLETVMSWSPSKCEKVGAAAKETIEKTLAPELIAQKRIEAYKDLINRGKYPVKPNQWLVDAVSPHKRLDKPLAFLDRLPLRELVNYTINRSLTKALRKKLNKQ
jgi:glycosyltransferase involved in cell wall biosynthesis